MQTRPESISVVIGKTLVLIAVLVFLVYLFFPSVAVELNK